MHAIFVHGIGQQKPGYSAFAQKKLRAALKVRGATLYAQEVCWAPVLDKLQAAMLKQVSKRGSAGNLTQRVTIGVLADALCYQHNREPILDLMDRAALRLRTDNVVVFAHSLGVVIALDWLRSRPVVNGKLFSFGANAQLFSLGGTFDCPNQLRAERRWFNAFYRTDAIGFPLSGWQEQVSDIEVKKPFWSLSTIVPGAAHTDYFGDGRLWGSTVPGTF